MLHGHAVIHDSIPSVLWAKHIFMYTDTEEFVDRSLRDALVLSHRKIVAQCMKTCFSTLQHTVMHACTDMHIQTYMNV